MKYSHFRKEALMYNKNIITEQYKTKNTPYVSKTTLKNAAKRIQYIIKDLDMPKVLKGKYDKNN